MFPLRLRLRLKQRRFTLYKVPVTGTLPYSVAFQCCSFLRLGLVVGLGLVLVSLFGCTFRSTIYIIRGQCATRSSCPCSVVVSMLALRSIGSVFDSCCHLFELFLSKTSTMFLKLGLGLRLRLGLDLGLDFSLEFVTENNMYGKYFRLPVL